MIIHLCKRTSSWGIGDGFKYILMGNSCVVFYKHIAHMCVCVLQSYIMYIENSKMNSPTTDIKGIFYSLINSLWEIHLYNVLVYTFILCLKDV